MESYEEMLKRLMKELDKNPYGNYDIDKYPDYTWIKRKVERPYDRGIEKEDPIKDIIDKLRKETSEITIKDVLKKFKPEELVEAIGIEKVESILRAHKIKILKKKIKNV